LIGKRVVLKPTSSRFNKLELKLLYKDKTFATFSIKNLIKTQLDYYKGKRYAEVVAKSKKGEYIFQIEALGVDYIAIVKRAKSNDVIAKTEPLDFLGKKRKYYFFRFFEKRIEIKLGNKKYLFNIKPFLMKDTLTDEDGKTLIKINKPWFNLKQSIKIMSKSKNIKDIELLILLGCYIEILDNFLSFSPRY
jgi:hypothetical protein